MTRAADAIRRPRRSASEAGRRADRGGFTLIEVMIVVAIIGILAALVIDVTNAARKKRLKLLALTQIKDITQAAKRYFEEIHAYPPDTGNYGNGDTAIAHSEYAITRYLGSRLKDEKTGQLYDPFLVINQPFLKGDEQVVDGTTCRLFMDPWGHPYEMDCMHINLVKNGDAVDPQVVGAPYKPDAAKAAEQTLEVKVWSRGPDGKEGVHPSWYPDDKEADDEDNIMSWSTGN